MDYQLDENDGDQWNEEALPLDWCIAPTEDERGICQNETVLLDDFGLPWCEEHRYRSDFLTWGKAHEWPALEMEPYAVAHGSMFWGVAATQGTDEMIWLLMGAIDNWKEKQSA